MADGLTHGVRWQSGAATAPWGGLVTTVPDEGGVVLRVPPQSMWFGFASRPRELEAIGETVMRLRWAIHRGFQRLNLA